MRSGALIVADNADDSPEYLTRVRSAAGDYLSVPFADDVELSMRLEAAAPGDEFLYEPADASSSARGADGPA